MYFEAAFGSISRRDYILRVASCQLRVGFFSYFASCELRVASSELRVASWFSIISIHSILSF